ncbi:Flp family type IVb pilin [Rubripirellula amarantea]|uniref:Flp/Fap pilin component n=1 Tax=Rubripirellula amarantea TaxID=2527999 RepID=A0A5C5WSW5_9BACT|nr:Flp family type IVb pilin [Rubripirellula amarantea]MDA8744177.1 Flp family type IVb pilin [Rubripirellula amarantea]TWT53249.1 Flp/Fap pilin component [Rubripirellula amarantea]
MLKKAFILPIQALLSEEDGTTSVEYAVMMALILLAVIGSVLTLSLATKESFDKSSDAIANAFSN